MKNKHIIEAGIGPLHLERLLKYHDTLYSGIIYGADGTYLRIGDAATTGNSLSSQNDLLITGKLEVKGLGFLLDNVTFKGQINAGAGSNNWFTNLNDNYGFRAGASGIDAKWIYQNSDSDARCMIFVVDESADSGNNVPAFMFAEDTSVIGVDLGLLDEVVQPHLVTIENAGKYLAITDATCDTGNKDELLSTGDFANALVGDVVRITAGSGTTIVGWYWITDISGANDSVTLDRDCCTDSVTGINFVAFHGLSMITPRAFYLPIYDGAPDDNDIDIDMAGAMALDVGQTNGRLYWRIGDAWHYVDATAGLSLPANERVDKTGHKFELGDTVKLVIDRINEDGSFHAEPIFAG